MPTETPTYPLERLHTWLTVYARAGGRVEIHHNAESDISSDVEVVLRADVDPHLATDRDAILENAILGALDLWNDRTPRTAEGPTAGQKKERTDAA
jgi:hypothetical protein